MFDKHSVLNGDFYYFDIGRYCGMCGYDALVVIVWRVWEVDLTVLQAHTYHKVIIIVIGSVLHEATSVLHTKQQYGGRVHK